MSAPLGATWRSGYATVCKTVYTSSILVVASTHTINGLRLIDEVLLQQEANQPSGNGMSGQGASLSFAGRGGWKRGNG
jgi:hypothetical protein